MSNVNRLTSERVQSDDELEPGDLLLESEMPLRDLLYLGSRFRSYDEFQESFDAWMRGHYQVFITVRSKVLPEGPLKHVLQYKARYFRCVHHDAYIPKGTGERVFTHTRASDCNAKITIAARTAGYLEVTVMDVMHSHENTKDLWMHYRESRRLSQQEKDNVVQMFQNQVPVRAINAEVRRKTGKAVTNKDLFNIRQDADVDERGGRNEEQMLDKVLQEIRGKGAEFRLKVVDDKLIGIVIATAEMVQNFRLTPSVNFLDATYKVNRENYCLYAMVCEDRNGYGQPVAIGLLASETDENLNFFFDSFKEIHHSWEQIDVIFMDKDFQQLKLIERQFPDTRPLLCLFHVLKWLKQKIGRLGGTKRERNEIYRALYRTVYSFNENTYNEQLEQLREICPPDFLEYLEDNWFNCPRLWCMAFRGGLRTLGNNTNNTIESFFHAVKAAIKLTRRSTPHIAECVKIVFQFIAVRVSVALQTEFVNSTSRLIVRVPEQQNLFDMIGREMSDLAGRLLHKQYELYKKTDYDVMVWDSEGLDQAPDNSYSVTNRKNGRIFYVVGNYKLNCSCYSNGTYVITCRHIMVVLSHLKMPLIRAQDCWERWNRKSRESPFIFTGALREIDDFSSDEVDDEDEHPLPQHRNQRYTAARKVTKHLDNVLADLPPQLFTTAIENLVKLQVAFIADLQNGGSGNILEEFLVANEEEQREVRGSPISPSSLVARRVGRSTTTSAPEITSRFIGGSSRFVSGTTRLLLPVLPEVVDEESSRLIPRGTTFQTTHRSRGRPRGPQSLSQRGYNSRPEERSEPDPQEVTIAAIYRRLASVQPARKRGRTNGPMSEIWNVAIQLPPSAAHLTDDPELITFLGHKNLRLTAADLAILDSNDELSGGLIDAAVYMLRHIAAERKLVHTGLFYQEDVIGGGMVFEKDTYGLQLLHETITATRTMSVQHWIVIQRIEGQIYVFDSIAKQPTAMTSDMKKSIFQLQGIPFRQLNSINVLYPRAQQQPAGSNHCGLHAIANLTELIFGLQPSEARFAGPKLKPHLKECIIRGKMSVFPKGGGAPLKVTRPHLLTIQK